MNLLEAARAIADFKQLALLVSEGPAGGDARWDAVQDWLRRNPTYETMINHCLSLSPANAVTYLCNQWGIDANLRRTFDPQNHLTSMAASAVEQLQTLYKERKELDANKKIQPALTAGRTGADPADHRRRR